MTLESNRRNPIGSLVHRESHPLDLFRREFSSLFDRLWGGGWMTPFEEEVGSRRFWDFDVREDEKEVAVRAEVPGFDEKDLDVRVENNRLTIQAHKEDKENGREEYRELLPHGNAAFRY